MSGIYDSVEPAVIDDNLLKSCVEEQGPVGEAGKIAKREGIDFSDVIVLRLDFRNILKTDNLWRFKNLTKLQLDNNIIEKIEGLTDLVNLEWLDLSFNNIEVIQGLEKLTNLQDLTLYNNRISSIGNMDSLQKLNVFSIGNNQLKNINNLVYLRRFKELNTLNLSGNPFCGEDNYYAYTIAHLPALKYLDYRLIDKVKREEAIALFPDSIEELVHDEEALARKLEQQLKIEEERVIHKDAYVEGLNGNELFKYLFEEDNEIDKLSQLPGIPNMLATYEENFTNISISLFEYGIQDRETRNAEKEIFFSAMQEAKEENRQESVKRIKTFEKHKTKFYSQLTFVTDQSLLKIRINELTDDITALWDSLMTLEMQLVDQIEESNKEFERHFGEMVGTFIESIQDYFGKLRDLELAHHEKLSESSLITLEKFLKNELEEEMSDDARMLLVDKDTVMNAVSASHDIHTGQIDSKEDTIVTKANNSVTVLMNSVYNDEINRNRSRVLEINNLIDNYREELETFEGNMGL